MHNSTNDSTKKRRVAIRVLLVLISFTAIVISYFEMAGNIRSTHRRYIKTAYDETFEEIEDYISMIYRDAITNTTEITQNLEQDIREAYPDMDEFKKDLDGKNYDKLIDVITDRVSNIYYGIHNQRNNVFVATNDNILYDYNYMYTLDKDNSVEQHSTWQQYIEADYNQELSKIGFSMIYDYPDDMVIIEPYKSEIEGHEYYDHMDMDILKQVYMKEGIEGLKGYELLVPGYIHETEDIFGQQEIKEGIRQDTHRLIVIQRINIYDQLVNNLDIDKMESDISQLKENTISILTSIYLVGTIIIVGACILLAHICALVNNQFIIPMEESKKQSTN